MIAEGPAAEGLDERVEGLSPGKLDLLFKRLRGKGASAAAEILSRPRNAVGSPLSFAQERLWFLDELQPGRAIYNVPTAFRLTGPLHVAALETALNGIVRRHEVLRTTFASAGGRPLQRVAPEGRLTLPVVDLGLLPAAAREGETARLRAEEARRPFDLSQGPLLRASLLGLGEREHVLLLTLHHIVADAWSLGILIGELAAFYEASFRREPPALPALPVQYVDYVLWQRERLQGDRLQDELAYWTARLAGLSPLELPTDRPRPAVQSGRGRRRPAVLPCLPLADLRSLAEDEGATLFIALLAAFELLLHRYTAQEDVTVGTVIANRDRPEVESLIGFFLNTLVMRGTVGGEATGREWLREVRDTTLAAYAHKELPFERLVDELRPERSLDRNPLVQVAFSLQNAPLALALPGTGCSLALLDTDNGTSKLDLYLMLWEEPGGLAGMVEYSTDLFEAATVTRMVGHLEALLAGLVAAPDLALAALPLLRPGERQQVLLEWNDTRTSLPAAKAFLHRLFAMQAEHTPEAVALACGDEQLTYRALAARAACLAHHLAALGVGPEVPVGIAAERSVEMVVGLLAILMAGGAYLPLDPEYPRARLERMLGESRAPVLLAQGRLLPLLPASAARTVLLEGHGDAPSPAAGLHGGAVPDNLAYVIYTSGSTGAPKGVMNTHRAIANRILWMQRAYGLEPTDRVLQKTPFSFDVSVWEFFWPLAVGARLVLARPGGHQDSAYLAGLIAEQGITTLHFVPAMLQVFLEEPGLPAVGALRRVIASGEALTARHRELFFSRLTAELHNLYGPTEAAVDVTAWDCAVAGAGAAVPIGRPIDNLAIHLLDREMRPVPAGVPGQLYIGGMGLARGYLHRPELTAERFVPDPLAARAGARLYATGDLAVHRTDGAIEYRGRIDHQCKLRGFRIELGEIEAVLREQTGVAEAVAVLREDRPGDPRLVAYAVPDAGRALPVRHFLRLEREGRLDGFARQELPNGMTVLHRNRAETDFVYGEVFAEESYLQHSVALADGACVFDVGANIGLFTLFVGTRVPRARIYAFEPIPAAFELLCLNAELYGLDVEARPYGLGESCLAAELFYYPNNSILSGRYADPEAERAVVRAFELGRGKWENAAELDELLASRLTGERLVCELRTLSQVIRDEGVERIDLLKIDVEKSERDVLCGIAGDDWPKIRQVVVEVHDIDGRLRWVEELLAGRGFTVGVAEERSLGRTGLYTVYAVRPEAARPASGPATPAALWSDPRRLAADLRQHLASRLPAPMVPAALVLLDALPLSPNGKVDRRALPAPAAPAETQGEAPRTPIEEMLADLWSEVLECAAVRRGDNFFELGGHSLKATQLRSRLGSVLGVDLPLQALFDAQTLAAQAALVETALRGGKVEAAPPIPRAPRDGGLPLSFAQQRLWFLDQLEPGSPLYNIPTAAEVTGRLDLAALARSFGEIVRRHESLRTTFREGVDGPVQEIVPELAPPLAVIDLGAVPAARREIEAGRLAVLEMRRPFNLTRGPLLRTTLLRTGKDRNLLLLTVHHIAADGWSMGVLVRELSAFYRGFTSGVPAILPAPPIQYADFSVWQRRWLAGEVLAAQVAYWRRQLVGGPVLELPTDRPRPAVETFRGANRPVALAPGLAGPLRTLARAEGATLYMVLLAAIKVLLASCVGREDIAVGSPVANRNRRETEDLIGFFANTLVMRTSLAGQPSFRRLVGRVRETALGAYAHQDLPFERLVEELQPQRDMSRNPLFQVMLVLQNAPLPPLALPGLSAVPRWVDMGTSKFDLLLFLWEERDHLAGLLEHSTDLFDEATVQRWFRRLEAILTRAAVQPDATAADLAGLTAAERHQLLTEWNDTAVPAGSGRCVHEWVEAQVRATPDDAALVHGGVELTYAQLNAQANRLAHFLRRLGVGPDVLVGICVERSWRMVVGLLGVLKAGGAGVALDPTYPEERLRHVIRDARLAALLTQESLLPTLPTAGLHTVRMDADWPRIEEESDGDPASGVGLDNPMYAIYTSGSTGLPKGITVPHRAFANLLDWQLRHSALVPRARTVQFATFGFCVSFQEIFSTLCAGGTLVLVDEDLRRDVEALWRYLEVQKIERLYLPFAALKQLADAAGREGWVPASLREVITAGEQLQVGRAVRGLFERLGSGCSLHNQYGASETHVVSSFTLPGAPDGWPDIAPVGRPVANTRIYLLDSRAEPVAIGVSGELYAGGACLPRGYLSSPVQTAQKLVPDPWSGVPGGRLYRTGDLARYLPDGRIEYFGRIDSQVKIRGFRVELGEVETVIKLHPEVRDAAVLAQPGPGGAPRLVAYVVPRDGQESPAELRGFLKQKLPEHMVPAVFVSMPALPLNANGKLDREALPAPGPGGGAADFVAPSGPVEEVLAQIWARTLGLPRIGARDNFFELGGHSLLVTQVATRVRRNFAVELPLRTFFEAPTVAELARAVVAREAKPGQSERIARALLTVRGLSAAELQEQIRARKGSAA